MTHQLEKRRHIRLEAIQSIQVFPVLPSKSGNIYEVQNKPLPASTIDISEGGVGLQISSKNLEPQAILKLSFETPAEGEVEVYSKIMWSDKTRCGVRFIMADQAILKAVKVFAGRAHLSNNTHQALE
jgi:c-di-GMP-binding flagellar brake protein YcgR